MDQYYVVGCPVKHSLSPEIHQQFAEQTNQTLAYDALEIEPGEVEKVFAELRQNPNVKGLSVTVPLKEKLYQLMDDCDELAHQAQAVSNVLFTSDCKAMGYNLDGFGLVQDLKNHQQYLAGKDILVLGAGGAVRGCLGALLKENPHRVVLANRTVSKAEDLCESYDPDHKILSFSSYPALDQPFDLVINATSASVTGDVPPVPHTCFTANTFGYDLMYHPHGTAFTQWCAAKNIKNADGKGMLLALSAEIFKVWRGVRPDPKAVIL